MKTMMITAGAVLAISAATAATTYEGSGQVPPQFVLSGKAADRLHEHNSINLETAEKLVAACQAIARRSNAAVVTVVLDPQGLTTSVYFQYGTTTSYGHTTIMHSQTGNTYRNITANISSLTTHTTYHFRIIATNNAGTRFGSDRTFTTP